MRGGSLESTHRVNLPRETVAARKASTQQLTALYAEGEALFDDGIDLPLRKTSPEFYATYRATRSVVDTRSRRSSEREETPPLPSRQKRR